MATPLKQMRQAAGMSLLDVAKRFEEMGEPSLPKDRTSIFRIEERGTQKLPVLRALANVYGKSLEEVESAAKRA